MEPEFIYLESGNWFELKSINKKRTQPYDLKLLEDEIMNQYVNKSDNLKMIDISFGKIYKNSEIEDIKLELNEKKFNKISEILKLETRHPIITFHGTNSLDTVNTILKTGYLIPGTNNKLKMAHGAIYGAGVYSSPHFDKALSYTKPDNLKYVYMLINMVFLGKVQLIPPGQSVKNIDISVETRVVFGLEQLVSTNSNKIIPVGYIKIKIS